MSEEDRIDALLQRHFRAAQAADQGDDAATERVMAALARPLPPQRGHRWRGWPTALLGWDFTPSWPRVAALAGCALVGFAIGIASPMLRSGDGLVFVARNDLGAVMSDPEPFTGVRP